MSFWSILGEIALFKWLFGSRNKNQSVGSSPPVNTTDYTPRRIDIGDYIADDSDNDSRDMYGSDYGRYHSDNDYSNYGSDQSHDDFLEEQDDYDMMDDDF